MENFFEDTANLHSDGEVLYADRVEHCRNGDLGQPNAVGRSPYDGMYVSKIMRRIAQSARKASDLKVGDINRL